MQGPGGRAQPGMGVGVEVWGGAEGGDIRETQQEESGSAAKAGAPQRGVGSRARTWVPFLGIWTLSCGFDSTSLHPQKTGPAKSPAAPPPPPSADPSQVPGPFARCLCWPFGALLCSITK